MWGNPLLAAAALMVLLSLLFYKVNLHFLAGGQLSVMLWMAAGLPVFALGLTLVAALAQPPNSYAALAALVALGNSLMGFGFRLLAARWASRDRR